MKRATLALLLAMVLLAACARSKAPAPVAGYDVATAERGTLALVVEAAGVIEPVSTVELKSKASGEILEIGAETGDTVRRGALLVRIDPRTPRNRLAQAEAQLNAAQAQRSTARSQLERGRTLLASQWINQSEFDQLELAVANAEAAVVAARVDVENARIALEDTEVRAPADGTILSKSVEVGQVISSPTTDVGGGTALLQMADLSQVRVRALVDETDVGKLAAGQRARISVASFPGLTFAGAIEKIEPQAIVDQNVTLFPVLVALPNPDGRLRPGMNVEASFDAARREAVLTVPVAALRTDRDLASTAKLLGLPEEELAAEVGVARSRREQDGEAASRLGGQYWVVVRHGDGWTARRIATGLTDLDRVEVVEGLSEGEQVALLPSSGLTESQDRMRDFIRQRGGIPGITQRPDGAAAPAPSPSR
jgi:HlyD family secretion protein